MTYRKFGGLGHNPDSRYLRELRESAPRTAQLNAESEARSIQKLQAYVRPLPPRESDMAWREDGWMR